MKLQGTVEKLFKDNTNYTNPTQATNQASSLSSLSTDLYTDSKRFIYELLQNADDSSEKSTPVKVWIKFFDDFLVVAHTGKAFDERDLRGICNVNDGTKKKDSSKTGYKGIGFKSVFGQSEHVIIFSNDEYFRFDSSYPFEWKWQGTKDFWEQENERVFVNPWQIIPIYTERDYVIDPINLFISSVNAKVATIIKLIDITETTSAVRELSENVDMFLFLKNITEINFHVGVDNKIEINRTESNKITLKENSQEKAKWITSTINLSVPEPLKVILKGEKDIPEKLKTSDFIELSLAAKIDENGIVKFSSDEKLIYSYLPTDETKYDLPVLVNTTFLTTANREHLHENSKWNQWLFKSLAIEIFKWVSQLVVGEFQFQAYKLIPNEIYNNELGKHFNAGIKDAVNTVDFVASKYGNLIKIQESIIDFTFLSDKEFVGEIPIRGFVSGSDCTGNKSFKSFIKNTGFGEIFKRLGAATFEWNSLSNLLKSKHFCDTHTVEKNIELIKHIKYLSDKKATNELTVINLHKLPFILDHKDNLNIPSRVYFPTTNNSTWETDNSDLAFLHKDLLDWLYSDSEMRIWLGQLGVVEKTDINFVTKTIIPDSESYITEDNALKTLRDLFNLYSKGDLSVELLSKLSKLKLLTKGGTLQAAMNCFLSDYYSPRLKCEKTLELDIFVSESYSVNNLDKDEWKAFFKLLGVNEGIGHIRSDSKVDVSTLIKNGCLKSYFEEKDKKFYNSYFTAESYHGISNLNYIKNSIDNHSFSKNFWMDVIEYNSIGSDIQNSTAYWGYLNCSGQTDGNKVENYIYWFIKKFNCIPVVTNECKKSKDVLINTEENKSLAGSYLPVFDGNDLSPNWRSFFKFRPTLLLTDYLKLLIKISVDTSENGELKKNNVKRIKDIYKILLDQCVSWNESELQLVTEWSSSGFLLNTQNKFTACTSLKYFLDGNNSIFQEQFNFLKINPESKQHPNLTVFLNAFQITTLRQSDFELSHSQENIATGLITRLSNIAVFFEKWILSESNDDVTRECVTKLDEKIELLSIYEATSLKIKYGDIDFVKSVNIHFNDCDLFVTKPWNSNKVLLQLTNVLCDYFNLVGHDKKLNFLLISTSSEIREYFNEENIEMPESVNLIDSSIENSSVEPLLSEGVSSFSALKLAIDERGISPEFFHMSTPTYEKYLIAEELVSRAVSNIVTYLDTLPEYDCSNFCKIADSIIGGISKNGNDLTIVARPSDNNEVLLYYTAEFDVLEYVDAEFWCEDGSNVPHKITLGKLLKITNINKIPVVNLAFSNSEFKEMLIKPKSIDYEFNAIPFVPYEIAKVVSSFANTKGGLLVFGINEINSTSNEVSDLSTDFRMDEIIKKSIAFISPTPLISYDWVIAGDERIFVIKVERSECDIYLGGEKYVREGKETKLKIKESVSIDKRLMISDFEDTFAIIIGVENYAPKDSNQIPSVKYAENDALLFKNSLVKTMNIKEDNIRTFINGDALKSNLLYDLQGLFLGLTSKDRLVFYYVGHGFHNGITNYLSTYDMHLKNIEETAISLREVLLDPLSKSKCKSTLIFIDACAKSFKNENSRSTILNFDGSEITLLTSEHHYSASFFSCQPGESSYSCDDLKQGIWTKHLVDAIEGEVPDAIFENKYITDRKLNDYLGASVAKYTKDIVGKDQNPKAILDSNNEYIIAELT